MSVPSLSTRYALASHFFWGLWSTLQASMSTIEFGYLVGIWGQGTRISLGTWQAWLLTALGAGLSSGVRPIPVPVLFPAEEPTDRLAPLVLTAAGYWDFP